MAKVYVNLLADDGLPLTATISKAGTGSARTSTWSSKAQDTFTPAENVTFASAQVTETSGDNGVRIFRNNARLPPTGGARYTISVKKNNRFGGQKDANVSNAGQAGVAAPEAPGKQIVLDASRKLFVGLAYMQSLEPYYDQLKAKLPGLFAAAGLELEGPTQDGVAIADAECSTVDDAIGAAARIEDVPDGDKTGVWARVVLVNEIVNGEVPVIIEHEDITRPDDARLVQSGNAFGFKVAVAADARSRFFGQPVETLELTFANPVDKVRSKKVPLGQLACVIAADRKSLVANLTDDATNAWLTAGFAGGAGGVLQVEMVASACETLAGLSQGAKILIAINAMRARYVETYPAKSAGEIDAMFNETLPRVVAHELCHAMGGPANNARGVAHASWYPSSKGGLASVPIGHCNTNAAIKDSTLLRDARDANIALYRLYEPTKAQVYVPEDGKAPCIMFHALWTPSFHQATFCPNCLRQLRGLDLSRRALKASFEDKVA